MNSMSKQKTLPTFFVLAIFCLLLISLGKIGFFKPLQSGTERMTTPVKMSIYRLGQGINDGLATIKDLWGVQSLRQENEKLKKENLASQGDSLRSYSLEEENKALRQQLEAPLPAQMKFLPAKTLGLTGFLTLDKGEEDGVIIGQTVVSGNFLVGKIRMVSPRTSEVLLPTDPDSLIPVRTVKTAGLGLLTGEFGTKAELAKVLQSENLEKDDLLITTGEAGYQRDLIIGKIVNVVKDEVQPFQKAEVNLSLDYSRLENVFLVK